MNLVCSQGCSPLPLSSESWESRHVSVCPDSAALGSKSGLHACFTPARQVPFQRNYQQPALPPASIHSTLPGLLAQLLEGSAARQHASSLPMALTDLPFLIHAPCSPLSPSFLQNPHLISVINSRASPLRMEHLPSLPFYGVTLDVIFPQG